MKTNFISNASGWITATALLLSTSTASGGILKILKGEKEKPCACEEFQKVAFVGGAQVKEVKGNAEVLTGVDKWTRLSAGRELKVGDMIRTKAGGKAVLKMRESGSLVSVTPQTILRLVPFEKEWGRSALTGESECAGYVVRALRGQGEYRTEKGWEKLKMDMELEPGTRIRLVSGKGIDLFSKEHGVVRLSEKGEAKLPMNGEVAARQLKTTPVVAASVRR